MQMPCLKCNENPTILGGSFCFQCCIKDIDRSAPEAELIAAGELGEMRERNRILALFKKEWAPGVYNCLRRMIERGVK